MLILAATLFYSCTNNKKEPKNNNDITYHTADVNSGGLSATPQLTGNIEQQVLSAEVKLSNTGSKDIGVQEIAISATNGSRSLPVTPLIPFSLKHGEDTTIALKFDPYNDYALYQVTGMHGSFKPAYDLTVSYNTDGGKTISNLLLKSAADKSEYLAYSKKHIKRVTGYSFNTKNKFNENEKRYLETLKQVPKPPFVYLSDQEIAVCGLNFRLKNYYLQDTLYAELFVVNHAGFPVKIIPAAFDITTAGDTLVGKTKTVTIEKVSGTQQNLSLIEQGDRVLIHFKKFVKIDSAKNEKLVFNIRKAFILNSNTPLFDENIELLPHQF